MHLESMSNDWSEVMWWQCALPALNPLLLVVLLLLLLLVGVVVLVWWV